MKINVNHVLQRTVFLIDKNGIFGDTTTTVRIW